MTPEEKREIQEQVEEAFEKASRTGKADIRDKNGKVRFTITIPQEDLEGALRDTLQDFGDIDWDSLDPPAERKLAIPELREQERVAPLPREDDPEISEEDWKLLEAAFSTPLDHE